MLQSIRVGVALPAIFLSLSLAGCAGMGSSQTKLGGFGGTIDKSNIGLAMRAQQALTSGNFSLGIDLAEQAVSNRPNDAGFRSLLGNAYLTGGRFASAEAAYRDALSLVPTQQGIPLKMVLATIAQGKNDAALRLMDEFRGTIDPADVGLALALAGQPGNAIAMLNDAARSPASDARVRQNLALAYALAGDWTQARAVAAQDLPADQVDARITEWMTFAKPGSSTQQVASLIGVSPAASDPGQPVRLALRRSEVRLAQVQVPAAPQPAPVMEAAPAEQAPAPIAYVPPVTEPVVAATQQSLAEPVIPVLAAEEAQPILPAVTLASILQEPVRPSNSLPKASELRRAAAARFISGSQSVVQLGAYGSLRRVQAAWTQALQGHPELGRYAPASARFVSASGTVYRLSVQGFGSDRQARMLCQSLQQNGGKCFVRSTAGDQAVKVARR